MKKKKASVKKSAKATKKTAEKEKKMQQTHAKEEKFVKTTLDQVWGDTGNTMYGTMDEAKYASQLEEMNKTDLQAHASRFGMIPIQDRVTLTKKLITEFRKYVSGFKKPTIKPSNVQSLSKEAQKIMDEGK